MFSKYWKEQLHVHSRSDDRTEKGWVLNITSLVGIYKRGYVICSCFENNL